MTTSYQKNIENLAYRSKLYLWSKTIFNALQNLCTFFVTIKLKKCSRAWKSGIYLASIQVVDKTGFLTLSHANYYFEILRYFDT